MVNRPWARGPGSNRGTEIFVRNGSVQALCLIVPGVLNQLSTSLVICSLYQCTSMREKGVGVGIQCIPLPIFPTTGAS